MSNKKPGCLAAIFGVFAHQNSNTLTEQDVPAEREIFPYRLRDDFLSPAETSFYQVLKNMMGERLVICPQVSLSGVIFTFGDQRQTYQNKIDRKIVDFLLCDAKTLKPILAIELDDASHRRPDRQERDAFVEKVFETARLPLARVPVQATYNTKELATLFQAAMQTETAAWQGISQLEKPSDQAPTCPKCGTPMVQRIAKRGTAPGQSFWGCPNYPRCREMIAEPTACITRVTMSAREQVR